MKRREHTQNPLVSIVTPSFNQGAFIAQTITSVLTQDYPHIEYIVVDAGSSDGTLEILRDFGDRVRWISEPDRGQSDAINKGWRSAQGEIIAWLNADDVYQAGAIRRVVAFFREHPDIDLVYGDCDYIDEQGRVIGRHPARSANGADVLCSPVSIIAQPAAFLRRRLLESVGYLDESLHCLLDTEYWMRVVARHHIGYLPAGLAAFRRHADSKSARQAARFDEERERVYERFFASPDLPDSILRLKRKAMSTVYTRIANTYFLAGDNRARRYALAAWKQQPWRLRRTQLKILALGLAGPRGPRLAARLKSLGRSSRFPGTAADSRQETRR